MFIKWESLGRFSFHLWASSFLVKRADSQREITNTNNWELFLFNYRHIETKRQSSSLMHRSNLLYIFSWHTSIFAWKCSNLSLNAWEELRTWAQVKICVKINPCDFTQLKSDITGFSAEKSGFCGNHKTGFLGPGFSEKSGYVNFAPAIHRYSALTSPVSCIPLWQTPSRPSFVVDQARHLVHVQTFASS